MVDAPTPSQFEQDGFLVAWGADGGDGTHYRLTLQETGKTVHLPLMASTSPIRDMKIIRTGDMVQVWSVSQNGELSVSIHDPDTLAIMPEASLALTNHVSHGAGKLIAIEQHGDAMVLVNSEGFVHQVRQDMGVTTVSRSVESFFPVFSGTYTFVKNRPVDLTVSPAGEITMSGHRATIPFGTAPLSRTGIGTFQQEELSALTDVRDGTLTFDNGTEATKLAVSNGRLIYAKNGTWHQVGTNTQVSGLRRVTNGVIYIDENRRLIFLQDGAALDTPPVNGELLHDWSQAVLSDTPGGIVTGADMVEDAAGRTVVTTRADGGIHVVRTEARGGTRSVTLHPELGGAEARLRQVVMKDDGTTLLAVTEDGKLVSLPVGPLPAEGETALRDVVVQTIDAQSGFPGNPPELRYTGIEKDAAGKIVLSGINAAATPGQRDFVATYDTVDNRLTTAARALEGGSIGLPLQVAHADIRIPNSGEMFTLVTDGNDGRGEVHYFDGTIGEWVGTGLRLDALKTGADGRLYGLHGGRTIVPLDDLGRAYVQDADGLADRVLGIRGYALLKDVQDFTVDAQGGIDVLFRGDGSAIRIEADAASSQNYYSDGALADLHFTAGDVAEVGYELGDSFLSDGDTFKTEADDGFYARWEQTPDVYSNVVAQATETEHGHRLVKTTTGQFWHGIRSATIETSHVWQMVDMPAGIDLATATIGTDQTGQPVIRTAGQGQPDTYYTLNGEGLVRPVVYGEQSRVPGMAVQSIVTTVDGTTYAVGTLSEENGARLFRLMGEGAAYWQDITPSGITPTGVDLDPTGRVLLADGVGRVRDLAPDGSWRQVDRITQATTLDNLLKRSTSGSSAYNFDATVMKSGLSTELAAVQIAEAEATAQVTLNDLNKRYPQTTWGHTVSPFRPLGRRIFGLGQGIAALEKKALYLLYRKGLIATTAVAQAWAYDKAAAGLSWAYDKVRTLGANAWPSSGASGQLRALAEAQHKENRRLLKAYVGTTAAAQPIDAAVLGLAQTVRPDGATPGMGVVSDHVRKMNEILDRLEQRVGVNRDDWESSSTHKKMQGKSGDNLLDLLGASLDRVQAAHPSGSAARLSERIAALKAKGVHVGTGTGSAYSLLAGELMHAQNKMTTYVQALDGIARTEGLSPAERQDLVRQAQNDVYQHQGATAVELMGRTTHATYAQAGHPMDAFLNIQGKVGAKRHRLNKAAEFGGKLTENRTDKLVGMFNGMQPGQSLKLDSNWLHNFRPAFRTMYVVPGAYTGATVYAGAKRSTDYSIKLVKGQNGELKMAIGREVGWTGSVKARPWAGESGLFPVDLDFDASMGVEQGRVWQTDTSFTFLPGEENKMERVIRGLFDGDLSPSELLLMSDGANTATSKTVKTKVGVSVGQTMLKGDDQDDLGAPNPFISEHEIADRGTFDKRVFYYQNMGYLPNTEYAWDVLQNTTTTGEGHQGDGQYTLTQKSRTKWFFSRGWDMSAIWYQRLRGQGRTVDDNGDTVARLGLPIEIPVGSLSLNGTNYDLDKDRSKYNYALTSQDGYTMSYTPDLDEAGNRTGRDILTGVSYSVSFARDGNVFKIDRIARMLKELPKAQADALRRDLVNMTSFTTEMNRSEIKDRLQAMQDAAPELAAEIQLLKGMSDFTLPEERVLFERELSRLASKHPEMGDRIAQLIDENLHGDRWRPDNGAKVSISMGLDSGQIAELNRRNLEAGPGSDFSLQTEIKKLVSDPDAVRLKGISASETHQTSSRISTGLWYEFSAGATVSTTRTVASLAFTETATAFRYDPRASSGELLNWERMSFTRASDDLTSRNALAGQDLMGETGRGYAATAREWQAEIEQMRQAAVRVELDKSNHYAAIIDAYDSLNAKIMDLAADNGWTEAEFDRQRTRTDGFFNDLLSFQAVEDGAGSAARQQALLQDLGLDGDDDARGYVETAVRLTSEVRNDAALQDTFPDQQFRIGDDGNMVREAGSFHLIHGEVHYSQADTEANGQMVYYKVPAGLTRRIMDSYGPDLLLAMHQYRTGPIVLSDAVQFSTADIAEIKAVGPVRPERATSMQMQAAADRTVEIIAIVENYRTRGFVPSPAETHVLREFFGPGANGEGYDTEALRQVIQSDDAMEAFRKDVRRFRDLPAHMGEGGAGAGLGDMTPRLAMAEIRASENARREIGKAHAAAITRLSEAQGDGIRLTMTAPPANGLIDFHSATPDQLRALVLAHAILSENGSPVSLTDALATSSDLVGLQAGEHASTDEIARLEAFRKAVFELDTSGTSTLEMQSSSALLGEYLYDELGGEDGFKTIQGTTGALALGIRTRDGHKEVYLMDPLIGETVLAGAQVDAVLTGTADDQARAAFSAALGAMVTDYLSLDSGKTTSDGAPISLGDFYGIESSNLKIHTLDPGQAAESDQARILFRLLNGVDQPAPGADPVTDQNVQRGYVTDRARISPTATVVYNGETLKLQTLYDMGAMVNGERINAATDFGDQRVRNSITFDAGLLNTYLQATANHMTTGLGMVASYTSIKQTPVIGSFLPGAEPSGAQEARSVLRALKSRIKQVGSYAVLNYDTRSPSYTTALNQLNTIEFTGTSGWRVWDRLARPKPGGGAITAPGSILGRMSSRFEDGAGRLGTLQSIVGVAAYFRRKQSGEHLSSEEVRMGRIAYTGLGLDLGGGILAQNAARFGDKLTFRFKGVTGTKASVSRGMGKTLKSGGAALSFVSMGFDLYSATVSFREVNQNDDLDASTARFLRATGGLSVVTAALSGVTAVALLAGAATVAAAAGIVGAVVGIGVAIYGAVYAVKQMQDAYDINFDWKDKVREGFRAFIGMGPSEKTMERIEKEEFRKLSIQATNAGMLADALRVFAEDDRVFYNSPDPDAARVSHVVMSYGDNSDDSFRTLPKRDIELDYMVKADGEDWWSSTRETVALRNLEIETDEEHDLKIQDMKDRLIAVYGEENVEVVAIRTDDSGDGKTFQKIETRDKAGETPVAQNQDWAAISYQSFSEDHAKRLRETGLGLLPEYDIRANLRIRTTGSTSIVARTEYDKDRDYVLWQMGGAPDGAADILYGRQDQANWFNVYEGRHDVHGGDKDDRFFLHLDFEDGWSDNHLLDGGEGSDTLSVVADEARLDKFREAGVNSMTVNLGTLGDTPASQIVVNDAEGRVRPAQLTGIENYSGLAGYADHVTGTDDNNLVNGHGGGDEIHAMGGDDTIFVFQDDQAHGGAGSDGYIVARAAEEGAAPASNRITLFEVASTTEENAVALDFELSEISEARLVAVYGADGAVQQYDIEITLAGDDGDDTVLVLSEMYDAAGLFLDKRFSFQTRDGFSMFPQFPQTLSDPDAPEPATGADAHIAAFDGRFGLKYNIETDRTVDLTAYRTDTDTGQLLGASVLVNVPDNTIEVHSDRWDPEAGSYVRGELIHAMTLPERYVLLGEGTNYRDTIIGTDGTDFLSGMSGSDVLQGGKGGDVYVVAFDTGGAGQSRTAELYGDAAPADVVTIINAAEGREVTDEATGETIHVHDDDIIVTNLANDDMRLEIDSAAPDDVLLTYAPDPENARMIRLKDFMKGEEHRHLSVQDVDGTIWSIMLDPQTGLPVFDLGFGEGTGEADEIQAAGNSSYLEGLGGDDVMRAAGYADNAGEILGGDILDGGEGNDRLYGADAGSQLFGGDGDDLLVSYDADDVLATGFGNDIVDLSQSTGGLKVIDTASESDPSGQAAQLNRIILPFDPTGADVEFARDGAHLIIAASFTPAGSDTARDIGLLLADYFADGMKRAVQLEYHGAVSPDADVTALQPAAATAIMTRDGIWQQAVTAQALDSGAVLFLTPEMMTAVGTAVQRFDAGNGHDIVVDEFTAQQDGQVHEIHGGDGSDQIFGRGGDDRLFGEDGDDILLGEDGNDELYGGAGDDYLEDLSGDNILDGGDGDDVIEGAGRLFGGKGSDTISGSNRNDHIETGFDDSPDAVNYVNGFAGADTIHGGAGTDYINGGEGRDTIKAQGGNDVLYASSGGDHMGAGAGWDILSFEYVDAPITAEFATRTVSGSWFGRDSDGFSKIYGFEEVVGSEADDDLTAGGGILVLSGAGGSDVLTGTAGNDELHAEYGDDGGAADQSNTLAGLAGDDVLTGSNGDDLLDAGAGDDTIRLFGGIDTVVTGTGADVIDLREATGHKTILTEAEAGQLNRLQIGFDLYAGETVIERDGDDLVIAAHTPQVFQPYLVLVLSGYFAGPAGQRLQLEYHDPEADAAAPALHFTVADIDARLNGSATATDGDDVLVIGTQDFRTVTNADQQLIQVFDAGLGDDDVDFRSGGDTGENVALRQILGGAGNDVLTADDGLSHLIGGIGNDTLTGGAYQDGDEGNDILQMGLQTHRAFGGAGHDTLQGSDGDDVLYGGDGDDTLSGGAGNDRLGGGFGHDIIDGGAGDDVILATPGMDIVRGGAGHDTLTFEQVDGPILFDRPGGLIDVAPDDRYGPVGFTEVSGIEKVVGSEQDDELIAHEGLTELDGGGGNDALMGTAGTDLLDGGEGDDVLIATTGGDTLIGGEGRDVLSFELDQAGDRRETGLTVDLAAGILPFGLTVAGLDGIEILRLGDGADTVHAAAGFTRIETGKGDDTLIGGQLVLTDADGTPTGAELAGGAGDDLFIAGVAAETYEGGEGIDTVDFSAFAGGVGLNFAQQLFAALGPDTDDGPGVQAISGIETVIAGAGADEVTLSDTGMTAEAGAGDDRIIGGAGDDRIMAGDGNDTVLVSGGTDRLHGGAGAEDVLSFEALVGAVYFDLDDIAAFATAAEGHFALAEVSGFETVRGTDFADRLSAGTGQGMALHGGAGNDILISKAQQGDALHGEDGDDLFIVNDLQTVVHGGAGFDTVRLGTAISEDFNAADLDAWTGIEAVEGTDESDTLYLSDYGDTGDDAPRALFGRGGDDVLQGTSGDLHLDGGSGDDLLTVIGSGGAGDGPDRFVGGLGHDILEFLAPSLTIDFSQAGADGGPLVSQIEEIRGTAHNDHLTSDGRIETINGRLGDDTLIGSDNDDHLIGDDGTDDFGIGSDDRLEGKGGNDILEGGIGDDYAHGGSGNDRIYGGAGDDELRGNHDDDIVMGGSGNDEMHGGTGNDVLDGGSGDDNLIAGSGDDLLYASEGNDRYNGGSGFDTLSFANIISPDNYGIFWYPGLDDSELMPDFTASEIINIEALEGSHLDDVIYTESQFHRIDGSLGNDVITARGDTESVVLIGGAGDDSVSGHESSDEGVGSDLLFGDQYIDITNVQRGQSVSTVDFGDMSGDGEDILFGTGRQEYLVGGGGDDDYYINTSYASDNSTTHIVDAGGSDYLNLSYTTTASGPFLLENSYEWVWFDQDGEDLVITYRWSIWEDYGTTVVVDGWFNEDEAGKDFRLERLKVSGQNDNLMEPNFEIDAAGIDQLVSVMQHYDAFSWDQKASHSQSIRSLAGQLWS